MVTGAFVDAWIFRAGSGTWRGTLHVRKLQHCCLARRFFLVAHALRGIFVVSLVFGAAKCIACLGRHFGNLAVCGLMCPLLAGNVARGCCGDMAARVMAALHAGFAADLRLWCIICAKKQLTNVGLCSIIDVYSKNAKEILQ